MSNEESDVYRNAHDKFDAISAMPECCEKSLLVFMDHTTLLGKGEAPRLSAEEFTKLCDKFETQRQVLLESLAHDPSSAFHFSLQPLRSLSRDYTADLTNETLWCVIPALTAALLAIQRLDMQLIVDLTAKSAATSKSIKGQDVILLLGGTGAGKSTTIHFLAGSDMIHTEVNGHLHIGPNESTCYRGKDATFVKDLEQITLSNSSGSETRSILSVTVECPGEGEHSGTTITLCDTPGFEDTDGPEMDIANGLGIISAVQQCRSVRPLFLLGKHESGNRQQGYLNVGKTLGRLIADVPNNVPGCCSYAFTKFDKGEIKAIKARLLNLWQTCKNPAKNQQVDDDVLMVLKDMLNFPDAAVIDPVEDDPNSLLRAILSKKPIMDPGNVFRVFVSDKSMSVLKDQLQLDRARIKQATNVSDVDLMGYKLTQLQTLSINLPEETCKVAYRECSADLATFGNETRLGAWGMLTAQYDGEVPMNQFHLKNAFDKLQGLANMCGVVDEHLAAHAQNHVKWSDVCAQDVDDCINRFREDVENMLEAGNLPLCASRSDICKLAFQHQFDKLKEVVRAVEAGNGVLFPPEKKKDAHATYKRACAKLNQLLLDALGSDDAKCDVADSDASKFIALMDAILHALNTCAAHVDGSVCEQFTLKKRVFWEECEEHAKLQISALQCRELPKIDAIEEGIRTRAPPTAKKPNPGTFALTPGTRVRLHGLRKVEYNGLYATICSGDGDCKPGVEVPCTLEKRDGTTKKCKLKVANLEAADAIEENTRAASGERVTPCAPLC